MHTIAGVSTSNTLFIGWAAEGPTGGVVRLTSFSDYEREFGGLDQRALLSYSVKAFHANGGTGAYVLRIARPGDDAAVVGVEDPDFLAAVIASFASGGPLDEIDVLNLVCVPGLTDATTISVLQGRCRARRAFLIVDCAETDGAATVAGDIQPITGGDAINSAFYFPWVRCPDPMQAGAPRNFPPSGFVAGVFARTDSARGVWKAPAGNNATLSGAIEPAIALSSNENEILNPRGINCIRTFPGFGTVIWGARTLRGDDTMASEWKYVPVRRTALFLEESIRRGTQWVESEPNDETTWSEVRACVGAFLHSLFLQGAFQGTTPSRAYFVKCGSDTSTQIDVDQGRLNILVGFAPLKPAEFVVIRVQQIVNS